MSIHGGFRRDLVGPGLALSFLDLAPLPRAAMPRGATAGLVP
jgi:hypothetical protein